MTIPGPTVTIFGRGWGHGVGLSQYGARGRAFAGQDAATILAHYYPGTTIGSIPTTTLVRVLLVDDLVPTAGEPPRRHRSRRRLDDRRRRRRVPGRCPAAAGPDDLRGRDLLAPGRRRCRGAPCSTRARRRPTCGSVRRRRPRRSSFRPRRRRTTCSAARCASCGPVRGSDVVNELLDRDLPPRCRASRDAVHVAGRRAHRPDDRRAVVRGLPAAARCRDVRRVRRHPLAGVPGCPRRGGRRRQGDRRHVRAGAPQRHGDRERPVPLDGGRRDGEQRERLRLGDGGAGRWPCLVPPRLERPRREGRRVRRRRALRDVADEGVHPRPAVGDARCRSAHERGDPEGASTSATAACRGG